MAGCMLRRDSYASIRTVSRRSILNEKRHWCTDTILTVRWRLHSFIFSVRVREKDQNPVLTYIESQQEVYCSSNTKRCGYYHQER